MFKTKEWSGPSREETPMNPDEANINMLKMVSETIVYSLGIGVTFGSALVAVVTILR